MKNKVIILFVCIQFGAFSQIESEFEIHLQSIDSTYSRGYMDSKPDTIFNSNRAFVNYTIKYLLQNPGDKFFISNRNILTQLITTKSDSVQFVVEDTLVNGKSISININVPHFVPEDHEIERGEDDSVIIQTIDNYHPYGGVYGLPINEIKEIEIAIDGKLLSIPDSSYADLFNVNTHITFSMMRRIEAYESLTGDFIYIYFFGGNAAGTWFSKLIFDNDGYKTRIVSGYYPLSIHGSFRDDFVGF